MSRRDIQQAHDRAVKAAQQYEAATPGTRTKEKAWERWQAAERAFSAALARDL